MDLSFFVKGFILGFSIAAPVGPIGVLCIRKTLQFGRLSGFFSGLGAAVADAVYAIIATFGLTLVSNFLLAGQYWLQLIGGAFLIYLGIKTFIAKPNETSSEVSHKTLAKDFISTFFLTIINPVTILTYLAIFAGLGFSNNTEYYAYSAMIWLVFGVFIGSALWWLILSEGVTLFRKKMTKTVMTWVNRFAGLIIFGFGVVAWLSLA